MHSMKKEDYRHLIFLIYRQQRNKTVSILTPLYAKIIQELYQMLKINSNSEITKTYKNSTLSSSHTELKKKKF